MRRRFAHVCNALDASLGRLGHHEIREVIGKGRFGTVLRALDEKLHRAVAIKVLAPSYAAIGSARTPFIREARTAAAIKIEHVVADSRRRGRCESAVSGDGDHRRSLAAGQA